MSEWPTPTNPLRIVFWGTYDLSKPRTRILRDGLTALGVEVVEIHADVWSGDRDKSQLSRVALAKRVLRLIVLWPFLILRYLFAPAHHVVVVPYMGQLDVLVIAPFARLRGVPVCWDMFLSIYDTVVHDRRMASEKGIVARALKGLEWCSCRVADAVFLDTPTHAARMARIFSVPEDRFAAIPVGAEPQAFPRRPKRDPDGSIRILFYGQMIPLHGIDIIVKAARSDRGRGYTWHLIGSGQEQELVEDVLAADGASHIRWDAWLPYHGLADAITRADICLGIFGASDKAASVVPNKVYQALLSGRSVITRASPAIRDIFPIPDPGLRLVPHSDPEALLDAVEVLALEGFPTVREDQLEALKPRGIAECLLRSIGPILERR